MKQHAPAFGCKRLRQLRDDRLRFAADLVTKHHHHVALRVCDHLTRGVDLACFDTGFLRGERIV